jgi:hypothetical protein
VYFGSINLADPVNTFNLEPAAVEPGDALVERWQRTGIGHVLLVMRSRDLGTQEIDGVEMPRLEAELASGSMPRRQPKWDRAAASKRYFTMDETGGPGYASYGGGVKRWRQAKNVNGRWTNVVADGEHDVFINSTDHDAMAARPGQFDQQDAFKDLYEVAAELGMTQTEVDRQYRNFEDYVFAELVYEKSKTCCWNSSTAQMYDLAIEYNLNRIEDPQSGDGFGLSSMRLPCP